MTRLIFDETYNQNNLSPEEEIKLLKNIYTDADDSVIYQYLINCYNIIQNRSQIILSLATICLTITGFSGAKIASSSSFSMICIAIGLALVLLSIVIVLSGPLQLKWVTQIYLKDIDNTMIELIKTRNKKTRLYHLAMFMLGIGLSFYVLSVILFLILGVS